jgi:hypothetical protein
MVDAGKLGHHLTSIRLNMRQTIQKLEEIQFDALDLLKLNR